jgi:hypothetical protein
MSFGLDDFSDAFESQLKTSVNKEQETLKFTEKIQVPKLEQKQKKFNIKKENSEFYLDDFTNMVELQTRSSPKIEFTKEKKFDLEQFTSELSQLTTKTETKPKVNSERLNELHKKKVKENPILPKPKKDSSTLEEELRIKKELNQYANMYNQSFIKSFPTSFNFSCQMNFGDSELMNKEEMMEFTQVFTEAFTSSFVTSFNGAYQIHKQKKLKEKEKKSNDENINLNKSNSDSDDESATSLNLNEFSIAFGEQFEEYELVPHSPFNLRSASPNFENRNEIFASKFLNFNFKIRNRIFNSIQKIS